MICTSMNHHLTRRTNVHLTSSARSDMMLIVLSLFAIFVITTFLLPKYIINHKAYADGLSVENLPATTVGNRHQKELAQPQTLKSKQLSDLVNLIEWKRLFYCSHHTKSER